MKRFILFNQKRHPKDMGEEEVSNFLTHLTVDIVIIYIGQC
ncbi:phage integrase N-terminal SAM-like domain-containing protein [Colwellia sp. 4_MG-2023]